MNEIIEFLINNFKRTIIWIITIVITIPLLIQILFWMGRTPFSIPTDFSPDAILSYFGSLMALLATLLLGFIAWQQNKKSNDINERLLNLESINSIPFIDMQKTFNVMTYSERCINLQFIIANRANGIIELVDVSNLTLVHDDIEINYTKDWLDGKMIVKDSQVEIDFIKETKDNSFKNIMGFIEPNPSIPIGLTSHKCSVSFKIKFLGSNELILQTSTFFIYIEKDKDDKILNEGRINFFENELRKITD